jgi:glycosyltransferase involved in cell wall biosynthesis
VVDVSVIIPARNERFLSKTLRDVASKARANTEIIAVLEGYWPDEIVDDPKVHYLHFSQPRGMRGAINAGVALARGKFVMNLDGHCMVSEGFDEVLAGVCQDDWVCVPTRYRLDPENWVRNDGRRPAINYLYINDANDTLDGKLWDQKNRRRDLDALRVDDLIAAQGSCYFLPRARWYELELLDEEHYGTFRKDPQEVIFKNWTYGGRCVRVKDCWYAHLHKGRRYGRGYSTNSADWKKGDEYVKQWWTDSAWAKQKIPLREIFRKFPDMPGWQGHPWMEGAELETRQEPPKEQPMEQYAHLPKTYQYLELDGKPFTRPRPERTHSRFWNQGKWESFIEPLLPEDPQERTLVEMGCDVGLFLKLATEHGFRRVVGVEKNRTPVKLGKQYRDAIGGDWRIIKRKLGGQFGEEGNFDIDELPVADVTLMSTFHYHIGINAWYKYIERLRTKTCAVLLVSRPDAPRYPWRVNGHLSYLKKYFAGWELAGKVDDVPEEGDTSPRKLYSVLFRNPMLRRVPIDAITTRRGSSFGHESIQKLTARVLAGDEIVLEETAFYADWRQRKPRWRDKTLRVLCQNKLNLVRSMIEVGQKDPILVQKDTLKISDGGHRLAILEALGYTTVIVREI